MNTTPTNVGFSSEGHLLVGLDVGSTTVKLVALDSATHTVCFRAYERHHAKQADCAQELIDQLATRFPNTRLRLAITGSGGFPLAEALSVPFMQEVVANATAVQQLHPQVHTAIELGGQDAKIIFFTHENKGYPEVSDMRMNGSCAGGTGAFIDEIAELLDVPVEEFNALACSGETIHAISGRCGVFAKTDIQPLAAAGVPKQDLALSAFHAIAKQTIGGLAQGQTIAAPVLFEGGPLLFNPRLVEVFAERLHLLPHEVIVPEHPETIVAYGAALLAESSTTLLDAPAIRTTLAQTAFEVSINATPPLFSSTEERAVFEARHKPAPAQVGPHPGTTRAYLGIDAGSTTTKVALISEEGALLDSVYASNKGESLAVVQDSLASLRDRWQKAGANLEILALGVTGYGEKLLAEALQAEVSVVETVAHAHAALAKRPQATFLLDIGGQDVKALWINNGVITNIVVNEACSSGCGSFLENLASTLGIAREDMAEAAFASSSPASLGSRCTVFMNSSIITAQRAGKTPSDIMAGLAQSVVENVFSKVIRTSNLDSLGDDIVVQGGTFANDAVLRAFELYLNKPVTRTPHPGLAGAIGAALVAQERLTQAKNSNMSLPQTFIGLDAAANLTYTRESNAICTRCTNHCTRTVIRFSTGKVFITGNRCSKGASLDSASIERRSDKQTIATQAQQPHRHTALPNLYKEREQALFKNYTTRLILPENGITIGLPRVLSLWDTAPFWSTLFRSLGFKVRFSQASTRKRYEDSLSSVASDTACFPAKLVHGHIQNLQDLRVDRIFMPIITAIEPEGISPHSESMCALVKGYPFVIRSSENPEEQWDIPFDTPLFHWHSIHDRDKQLITYLRTTFDIDTRAAIEAIELADTAQASFKQTLQKRGAAVLARVQLEGTFAVVLASRPYQNDPLVHHDIPALFADLGVVTIPADALPDLSNVDLSGSRLDITNNYHARMLSSALYAATNESLEYAQIVSFGCGHDAYLTDEIIRIMAEVSDKSPLVLKVDESDVQGPLSIRIRSFIETVTARRLKRHQVPSSAISLTSSTAPFVTKLKNQPHLSDPYASKFTPADRKMRTVLVPNTSHAFGRLMAAVFAKQGLRTVSLGLGGDEAIRLGKKYTHNDICFPAQMVIGEALAALESGLYNPDSTAIGMAKYVGDCRLTHYSALLRKALDDAGYSQVPIITNDDKDERGLHPGFKMNLLSALRVAYCLPMIDALEELLRKMRPYERVAGATESAFEKALDFIVDGVGRNGIKGAKRGFKKAIATMKAVAYDRSHPRPRVLVVGEYLLNFHPGANHDIERYLEAGGMEIIEARMTDVIRKTYFYQDSQVKEFDVDKPFTERTMLSVANNAFEAAHDLTDSIAQDHPLYEPPVRMPELVQASDPIIHHTFDAGEGVLIPAEILHHYERGVRSFVILQPFGCLPNHIVGRGIIKSLREKCPDAQILPLDYDPDVSTANIENRLQMLILRATRTSYTPDYGLNT